ncbi:MAG: fatty acid desaturase [Sulfuritalea sp.]|nr:fatty acid desaturase [Sulfuritalea sp.]
MNITQAQTRLSPATGRINVVEILIMHVSMVAWIYFAPSLLPTLPFYLLTLVISAVHQRQASEWLHEGLHFNIYPNRAVNDAVSQFGLAALFAINVNMMRAAHFRHHQVTAFFSEHDIDTRYAIVTSKKDLILSLLRDLFGLTALRNYLSVMLSSKNKESMTKKQMIGTTGFYLSVYLVYGSLGALFIYFDCAGVVVYLVSLATLYPVLGRFRLYGQHLQIDENGGALIEQSHVSRTVNGTLVDRIFISSRLMQYHWEHHKYPGMPFRELEKIAKIDYNDANRCTSSHWPVLAALWRM